MDTFVKASFALLFLATAAFAQLPVNGSWIEGASARSAKSLTGIESAAVTDYNYIMRNYVVDAVEHVVKVWTHQGSIINA